MSDADIAELLAVAYASHCAQCEAAMENPVSCDFFFDKYKDHIQEFRHLMQIDTGDRKLNG
ncbi:MAG: hypothetical protein HFG61_10825 [Lachnospiraceae bacterium]|nr:hypothetical protein [Lachnospiraceae bacterium]